ncbi:hypothetical protein MBRA_03948 [Methylobacterium brachiatum]|nr:hypothetical protein MBRA_03948 [Methylobacterium brachiatum]
MIRTRAVRPLALAGAAALLLGTAAIAQTPPPGGPRPGPEAGAPPPPPRAVPGAVPVRTGRPAAPGGPQRGPGPDGPPPPPPPPKGAHFRLERGDTRIDVKCADEDSMKACADITLQLVDKLGTLRPADAR